MICGGSAQTWDMKDSVFNIHSARVRERLRQSGFLVVNPTDLYDSLPKREGDPWHFRCLPKHDRDTGAVDLAFISLEALVTHSVLVTRHLIADKSDRATRGSNWLEDVSKSAAVAHLILAIQYDPREDVLPLVYSQRRGKYGQLLELQDISLYGVNKRPLRGRVLKAKHVPFGDHHFHPDSVRDIDTNRLCHLIAQEGERAQDIDVEIPPVESDVEPIVVGGQISELEVLRRMVSCRSLTWPDYAMDLVWNSAKHGDLRRSLSPYHWRVIRDATRGTINPVGSIFDLAPTDAGQILLDNYRAKCVKCDKRWWPVGAPILGVCDRCRLDVVDRSIDLERTLDKQPLDKYVVLGDEERGRTNGRACRLLACRGQS